MAAESLRSSDRRGDSLAVRAVVGDLAVAPLCVKCLASRRGFTRFAVEAIVAELRRVVVVDTTKSCAGCGRSDGLALVSHDAA